MVDKGRDEATTCRDFVLPRLKDESGWLSGQIKEQVPVTAGRIVRADRSHRRQRPLQADFVLEISDGVPVAVVEAKREFADPRDGLQQAKVYAEQLDLPVAISTNGHGVAMFNFVSGEETTPEYFPRPDELWELYLAHQGVTDNKIADVLREPFNRVLKHADGTPKEPRYYQRIAIHRTVAACLSGRRNRLLLTMATGTGKTFTAMQIVWKLMRYWEQTGQAGLKRVLYLTDRDSLIEQPMRNDFTPVFGEAVHRIRGEKDTARSIYFATYQALTNVARSDLFRKYPADFFDLVIVDECHRGSASEQSSWREILKHFSPAIQLGLTATPKRGANVDTYKYFDEPLYTYSLKQGIADGYLAPYRVRRVVLSPDAEGVRISAGELDKYQREIPEGLYETKDFERIISLLKRTDAAAQYLTDYLQDTDRMGKMVVFCVDSEHALDMRQAMTNANQDMARIHKDYAARMVSKEGDWGKQMLEQFQDPETPAPVVATTSRMLSTGVDIPTLRTVVLFRPIGSVHEFKQIIGRGTRLAEDYDKLSFEIIDFVGATVLFEDPEFDGPAEYEIEETIDDDGQVVCHPSAEEPQPSAADAAPELLPLGAEEDASATPIPPSTRKFVVEDIEVQITAEGVWMTEPGSDRLRLVEYRDYAQGVVRKLFAGPDKLRARWRTAPSRGEIADALAARAIALDELCKRTGLTDADPLDVLVHVAWNEPAISRHERVYRAKRAKADFFQRLPEEARAVIEELLERYAVHGAGELDKLEVLKLDPMRQHGSMREIASLFGGPERLRQTWDELQNVLYAA
ncbi:DEAD/DEAH box helicase family protein [Streptomyces actinomycinicus]|uniref:DEAD/DEAH box helicase family protein n=1 Tax=Streptomyces actinomycinicus TaxID=1695166 RepID=A0A937JR73_9ACTN|nr:DEAD/DEAH box helicase family protein [Streptomyces actinomycinicus]MBL1084208.1 DEAD/DEAH box helicase family protein [Streptomyces actinomycinicus]